MVRAPCCEKMGLKKGPWTPEEDQILVHYIHQHGHGNWRALPKQAGLLRCGKSCRLRWTNYLRPDIKRGNFTREEEDAIIQLHEMLGNRWSAIAARLPGRTDNEIKNVWHTHLKKRLVKKNQETSTIIPEIKAHPIDHNQESNTETKFTNLAGSPQECSSDDMSSSLTTSDNNNTMKIESSQDFLEMDEDFWSEVLSSEDSSSAASDFPVAVSGDTQFQIPFSPLSTSMYDSMEFWFDLFTSAGESLELPEIL